MPSAHDFSLISIAIERSEWAGSPSEAHGSLCGRACVNGAEGAIHWLNEMTDGQDEDDVLAQESRESFRQLAAETWQSLEAGDMSLQLLLPPDSDPIEDRALQIGSWCQGFLSGLGGDNLDRAPEVRNLLELPDIAEVLGDIAEIGRADVGVAETADEADENEAAYAELVEYVRVSVQLIFETVARQHTSEPETRH